MKLLLFITITTLFFAACSNSAKTQTEQAEIFFDDGYKKQSGGEIVIDDIEFSDKGITSANLKNVDSTPISKTGADGSRITYSSDGFGNQSESRCFSNHSRISCVVLKTAGNGEKSASVYALNGKIKVLPANMLTEIMNASPDDLASAAGISEDRNEVTLPSSATGGIRNSQPLQPLPSYKFPVQKFPQQSNPNSESPPSVGSSADNIPETKSVQNSERELAPVQNSLDEKPQF